MKLIGNDIFKLRSLTAAVLSAVFALAFLGGGAAVQVFAHGGEDHGEEKPAVATTVKGTVSRTMRLGDLEVTLKHPVLEPDTATSARLFITKFETNEAAGDAAPAMEIESANGSVTQVTVEKTDAAGSYNLKIPALPEGNYIVRANLKSGGAAANTATFSGVEVAHAAEGTTAAASGASWLGTALFYSVGLIILGLFVGLFYFAWRMAGEKQVREKAVSA